MTKKERYNFFIQYFSEHLPKAVTELSYKSDYELIVAVILSAQCTDKRVNLITPAFFKRFPTFKSLSEGTFEEVFNLIKSCSYPNNKAKHLLGMASKVESEFMGKLPDNPEALQMLPGVGRKTANVLVSVLHDKPVIAVDTHVFRVSARIGLVTKSKTPLETERQLTANIPEHLRNISHHWLILHGRYVCMARKPNCVACGLKEICKYYENLAKKNLSC
ncbi:MAG: endonuclease III [Bacteroidales bacterium]|nr:endonuclease III [Bacteroidales bacterium]